MGIGGEGVRLPVFLRSPPFRFLLVGPFSSMDLSVVYLKKSTAVNVVVDGVKSETDPLQTFPSPYPFMITC